MATRTPAKPPAPPPSAQLDLFSASPPSVPYGGGTQADADWWAFHLANPRVYALLRHYALQAQRAGQRVGIRAIWERMRWYVQIETHDPTGFDFKLNDHLTSRYARYLMDQEPELRGYFEVRELRS